MEKVIVNALMIAAAFLTGGTVASRFDAVWGEAVGLFGLLIVVLCIACVAGLWALNEADKERCE